MRFLVAGGGVAGVTAAQRLRTAAPNAAVTLLDAESVPYYLRPGLIDVIAGRKTLSAITPFSRGWFRDHEIDYRLAASVTELDLIRRGVKLDSGDRFTYDRLLLALGAEAACPRFPGAPRAELFTLRSALDANEIVARAALSRHAVVVGGGWLGLETARALQTRGLRVAVVEREPRLLPRQLDDEGSAVLASVLGRFGIALHAGVAGLELVGRGPLDSVVLSTGERLPAELAVVAAGIHCRSTLPAQAGLDVARGVRVDAFMNTSDCSVFAAGDVAEWEGRVYGTVAAAREQGMVAAANMHERGSAEYRGTIPSNRLKVLGVDLVCAGDTQPEGGPLTEHRFSDREVGSYRKLVLYPDGRIAGSVALGAGAVEFGALVDRPEPVGDPEALLLG